MYFVISVCQQVHCQQVCNRLSYPLSCSFYFPAQHKSLATALQNLCVYYSQIAFQAFVFQLIFQMHYSFKVFMVEGHTGKYTCNYTLCSLSFV